MRFLFASAVAINSVLQQHSLIVEQSHLNVTDINKSAMAIKTAECCKYWEMYFDRAFQNVKFKECSTVCCR